MMKRNWLMWFCCGLMVLGGGYWLWSRGVTNIAAFAMLLLCPLMHLFMHGGHGNHGHNHGKSGSDDQGKGQSGASCH